MLDIGKEQASTAKCYFSETTLPHYIDDSQPPTKRKPFSSILSQPFNHTLDLLAPKSSSATLQTAIAKATPKQRYARLHLKLSEILSGDFFNHYIKTGNILLLSSGRAGLDNTISLHNGILRLELDRATYERAGLQGQPIQDPSRKHTKSRFGIEFNLRLPSMVKGKKGFDRLVWAAENVFTEALTWLFADLQGGAELVGGVLSKFQPSLFTLEAEVADLRQTMVPVFPETMAGDDRVGAETEAVELLEWLSLAMLGSPRVGMGDAQRTDAYISRYEMPSFGAGEEEAQSTDLVRLRWHGFLPAGFVAKVFSAGVKATAEDKEGWFALRVQGFGARECTALKVGGRAMTWECE